MSQRFDLLIRNGLIVDGTGGPRLSAADWRVNGERIAAVGNLAEGRGEQEIDAEGPRARPGFIDVHTHDDRIVLDAPDMLPKVSQGVTTVVAGNCGISLAPVTFERPTRRRRSNLLGGARGVPLPDLRRLCTRRWRETAARGVNVAALVGHSALRARRR